jgi:hypothetical protein
LSEKYDWNDVIARLSADIPDPSSKQSSDPFGTQHFSQSQHIPMDPVQPPQQYDSPRRESQHGFPSGPGESSHIREDAAEPAQTEDFTTLALG